jgi:hypothetical protein
MDLFIVKLPRGFTLGVGRVSEWQVRADVVAVFPCAGELANDVLNAFAHDADRTIHAPLTAVLAAVAQGLAAYDYDYGGGETEPDEPTTEPDEPTTEYGTLCSGCRREVSPPPAPLPADPSAPRLTEEALARHTAETGRSRSRSRSPRGDRRCCIHCGRFEDESDEYGPYGTTCPDCLGRYGTVNAPSPPEAGR